MNVFIDTNVFYSFIGREDSSQLDELIKLLEKKEINLLLPKQVVFEYKRNTERELERFTRTQAVELPSLKVGVARISNAKIRKEEGKTQQLSGQLTRSMERLNNLRVEEVEKYRKKHIEGKTTSSRLIKRVMSLATIIEDEEEVIEAAQLRYSRGNPPRKKEGEKKDSIGDAIIWETLLKHAVVDNLTIVTKDKDFKSLISNESLHPFLLDEWIESSDKSIEVFSTIGSFINDFEKKKVISEEAIKQELEDNTVEDSQYAIVPNGIFTFSQVAKRPTSMTIESLNNCFQPSVLSSIKLMNENTADSMKAFTTVTSALSEGVLKLQNATDFTAVSSALKVGAIKLQGLSNQPAVLNFVKQVNETQELALKMSEGLTAIQTLTLEPKNTVFSGTLGVELNKAKKEDILNTEKL